MQKMLRNSNKANVSPRLMAKSAVSPISISRAGLLDAMSTPESVAYKLYDRVHKDGIRAL